VRPVVEAHGLDVGMGRARLLHDVGLAVVPGERIALVGHNGAGKSTLLRALSGFAEVRRGSLRVMDTALDRKLSPASMRHLRRRVAFVHQGLHLVDRASALDNVLVAAAGRLRSPLTWMRRWPAAERCSAMAALDRVGMAWSASRRTDTLSGGERQKVAIARALHQNAPIVLADEPTASLDVHAAEEVVDMLSAIVTEHGATLLCAIHDLSLVARLAERAIVLRHGRVVADISVGSSTSSHLRRLMQ